MDKPTKPKKRKIKDPESFRQIVTRINDEKTVFNGTKASQKLTPKTKRIKFSKLKNIFKTLNNLPVFKQIFKIIRLIGLIIIPKYVRNSFMELKGVTWPSFKESMRLTYAVIIFAVIFGVSVALVDYGLGKIFKTLLLKY